MRKILLSAAAILFSIAPAAAQNRQQTEHHVGGAWGHGGPGFTPRGAQPQQQAPRPAPQPPAPQLQVQHQAAPRQQRSGHGNARPQNRPEHVRPDGGRRDGDRPGGERNGRRPDLHRPRSDLRGPGYGGPRHDFSNFRDYHRNRFASRRFQGTYYRRPAGWFDHRWVFGEFLPPAYWARDYWLDDFGAYDLPPPPYGAVWVRVGEDALLIDQDTGEVVSVVYGVFY